VIALQPAAQAASMPPPPRCVSAEDVEAARAAARAALAPRPPPTAPSEHRSAAAAATALAGGIRRVTAADVLPRGARSLPTVLRRGAPSPLPSAPPPPPQLQIFRRAVAATDDGDADIHALLRTLSAAE
jgi:hypothetical protein